MLETSELDEVIIGQKGDPVKHTIDLTEYNWTSQGHSPLDMQTALGQLEKIRELVISYAGLTLQDPEMFPQPSGCVCQIFWPLQPINQLF